MSEAHILVVDDEPDITELLVVNLDLNGYRTSSAPDGVEALERVREAAPDLVLLDVMMPRLDGWEVLAALQEDEATRDIPVVMLTALADERDVIRGHLTGAVRYVTKPFDMTSLLRTVEEALEPLDPAQREARLQQLRRFLTRLAELETGRSGEDGSGVRFSRLEPPRRPAAPVAHDRASLDALTPRQLEIARMLGDGWDVRRIAGHLGTSRSNVYAARARIGRHLGVAPRDVPSRVARLGLGDPATRG